MLKINYINEKTIDEEKPIIIDIDGLSIRDIASNLPSEFESIMDQISRVASDSRTINKIRLNIIKQLNRTLETEGKTIEIIVSNLRKMSDVDDVVNKVVDNEKGKNMDKMSAIFKSRISHTDLDLDKKDANSSTDDTTLGSTYEDGLSDNETLEGDD